MSKNQVIEQRKRKIPKHIKNGKQYIKREKKFGS